MGTTHLHFIFLYLEKIRLLGNGETVNVTGTRDTSGREQDAYACVGKDEGI